MSNSDSDSGSSYESEDSSSSDSEDSSSSSSYESDPDIPLPQPLPPTRPKKPKQTDKKGGYCNTCQPATLQDALQTHRKTVHVLLAEVTYPDRTKVTLKRNPSTGKFHCMRCEASHAIGQQIRRHCQKCKRIDNPGVPDDPDLPPNGDPVTYADPDLVGRTDLYVPRALSIPINDDPNPPVPPPDAPQLHLPDYLRPPDADTVVHHKSFKLLYLDMVINKQHRIIICLTCETAVEGHIHAHVPHIPVPKDLALKLTEEYELRRFENLHFPTNNPAPVFGLALTDKLFFFCDRCHHGYGNCESLRAHQNGAGTCPRPGPNTHRRGYGQCFTTGAYNSVFQVDPSRLPLRDENEVDRVLLFTTTRPLPIDYSSVPFAIPEREDDLNQFMHREGWAKHVQDYTPQDLDDASRASTDDDGAHYELKDVVIHYVHRVQDKIDGMTSFGLRKTLAKVGDVASVATFDRLSDKSCDNYGFFLWRLVSSLFRQLEGVETDITDDDLITAVHETILSLFSHLKTDNQADKYFSAVSCFAVLTSFKPNGGMRRASTITSQLMRLVYCNRAAQLTEIHTMKLADRSLSWLAAYETRKIFLKDEQETHMAFLFNTCLLKVIRSDGYSEDSSRWLDENKMLLTYDNETVDIAKFKDAYIFIRDKYIKILLTRIFFGLQPPLLSMASSPRRSDSRAPPSTDFKRSGQSLHAQRNAEGLDRQNLSEELGLSSDRAASIVPSRGPSLYQTYHSVGAKAWKIRRQYRWTWTAKVLPENATNSRTGYLLLYPPVVHPYTGALTKLRPQMRRLITVLRGEISSEPGFSLPLLSRSQSLAATEIMTDMSPRTSSRWARRQDSLSEYSPSALPASTSAQNQRPAQPRSELLILTPPKPSRRAVAPRSGRGLGWKTPAVWAGAPRHTSGQTQNVTLDMRDRNVTLSVSPTTRIPHLGAMRLRHGVTIYQWGPRHSNLAHYLGLISRKGQNRRRKLMQPPHIVFPVGPLASVPSSALPRLNFEPRARQSPSSRVLALPPSKPAPPRRDALRAAPPRYPGPPPTGNPAEIRARYAALETQRNLFQGVFDAALDYLRTHCSACWARDYTDIHILDKCKAGVAMDGDPNWAAWHANAFSFPADFCWFCSMPECSRPKIGGWHTFYNPRKLCPHKNILKPAVFAFLTAKSADNLSALDCPLIPPAVLADPEDNLRAFRAWAVELAWEPLLNIHVVLMWLIFKRGLVQCPPELRPLFPDAP
ncbi:hypothetical protein B0H16DRAFT_1769910 [Mycena metata]|uniref:Uncharacterized protein n=1 Tax=Mycena metata TaxID=1033252 RepID=A0AAD7I276_9AGAR|nr:hypothetical protein B0H16DRAFT_1769910 [Mycena metata]